MPHSAYYFCRIFFDLLPIATAVSLLPSPQIFVYLIDLQSQSSGNAVQQ
jgi:hypothetical protein